MNKRQYYKSEFKKEVAIEALKERKTLQEIASEYAVAPSLVCRWKEELIQGSSGIFDRQTDKKELKRIAEMENKEARLERKVGELTLHVDFLKKKLNIKD